jgi:hypothetical protein
MASYNYNRNLDSHMMKNTEWGAAVYLSLSKYGLNGKIYANNNNKRITGCVGTKKSDTEDDCLNAYNTAKGYTASTTGNITGIYDMCGGAFDAMATTTVDSSNYMSEFAKYFDIYNLESNISSLNYRILGDATGELGQQVCANCASHYIDWFDSRFHFISKSSAIFLRGEESSNHASQLASTLRATDSFKWHQITSRLVLAV